MNHTIPKLIFNDLPDEALIRLRQLLSMGVVPYSGTTLWRKARNNEFPKPVKVSTGITAWRVGDIRSYLTEISDSKKGGAA
jgi:prophage regulatory protein